MTEKRAHRLSDEAITRIWQRVQVELAARRGETIGFASYWPFVGSPEGVTITLPPVYDNISDMDDLLAHIAALEAELAALRTEAT